MTKHGPALMHRLYKKKRVGKYHIFAALLLCLAGLLNFISGLITPLAAADPFSDAAGLGGGGTGMDPDGAGPLGGARGGGYGDDIADAAPDPYDGADPEAPNDMSYDGADGVGASAPPPAAIQREQGKTYGRPPAGSVPLPGYGAVNAETNPQLLAGGGATAADAGSEVVFDPATGMWTAVPNPVAPRAALAPYNPMAPGMPMGYDAFGRPLMAPGMPGMMPGWPFGAAGMAGQAALALPQAAHSEDGKQKDPKKQARREARREYERLRREEEEEEYARMDEEERRAARRKRQKRKERERLAEKLEKKDVRHAREVAEVDAQERAAMEEAQLDAARRREKNDLLIQKEQAIYDAQVKAAERQQAARDEEERAMMMMDPSEAREMEEHKATLQAQALEAAQYAVQAGEPLESYSPRNRNSYLSRASTAPSHYGEEDSRRNSKMDPGLARNRTYPAQRQGFQLDYEDGPDVELGNNALQLSSPNAMHQQYPPSYQQYPPSYQPSARRPPQHQHQYEVGTQSYRSGRDIDDYHSDAMSHIPSPSVSGPRSDTATDKMRLQARMQEERERVLDRQYADRMREENSYLAPAFRGSPLPSLRSGRSAHSAQRIPSPQNRYLTPVQQHYPHMQSPQQQQYHSRHAYAPPPSVRSGRSGYKEYPRHY